VKRLLCEGGGELNAAFFRSNLVDELHLTICPAIIGGRHSPTISDGPNYRTLKDAKRLKLKSQKHHGNELFLVYKVRK
jgi:riboflavin biosynthesis pyrimidine reductase